MRLKAKSTKSASRKLRLMLAVMSGALTLLPFYRSVEAQKQKKKGTAGVNSTNTQPISSDATKQKNVEVQTYTETVNRVGIEMVRVPSGKFVMGSPADEKDRKSDEGPQHEVTISQSFYMGKFEVTQLQWRAVSGLPKVKIDLPSDPAKYKGNNLPVETVEWYEAVEYCERLSRATGKSYRLPTEAEWEYACRAGTTGMYAGRLDEMGWYGNNSGRSRLDADKIDRTDASNYGKRLTNNSCQTHVVGQKQANRFGLYDMHGNVWEWCQDWYSENYYAQSLGTNPTGPTTTTRSYGRVGRGGGFDSVALYLRSANRSEIPPGIRSLDVGFRLVRTYN